MPRLPHILLFNPDQWRGDVLGHVGNAAAVTPTLDRMVREDSVSFSRAFCQNPVVHTQPMQRHDRVVSPRPRP
jgi:hypothetical protein